jgi:hypothetical protein
MNYPERALTHLAAALPREFGAEAYAIARSVPEKFLRGLQPSSAALAARATHLLPGDLRLLSMPPSGKCNSLVRQAVLSLSSFA